MALTVPAGAGVPPSSLSLLNETREVLRIDEREAPDDISMATLVSRGLSTESVEGLVARGIPENDIYRFVIPRRTFQRRHAARERLTPQESDRAERMARMLALARAVFDDSDRAMHWLISAKRGFDGRRPLDLVGSSLGAKLVEEALLRAYFGNVA